MNIALRKPMSRRHVLRGAGASLALPLLNAMAPRSLFGASEPETPLRMAFLYFPNGVYTPLWVTRDDAAAAAGQTIGMGEITGDANKLPPLLEPLQAYRDDFLLLSGLATLEGRPFNEGAAHAPAVGSYLTGVHPRKSVTCGTSVDQLAAQHYGHLTRLPSMEIATPRVNKVLCDKYPCIVTGTLSWRTPTQPLPVQTSPRAIFNRMFVDDRANPQRLATRSSILDAVREQAKQLSRSVDASDRHKIDEYLTSVRDIELRIERAQTMPAPQPPAGLATPPDKPPVTFAENIRLLTDLMIAAFQTDSTRICTFIFASEGSSRTYPEIGVKREHHDLSHGGGKQDMIDEWVKIAAIRSFLRQVTITLHKRRGILKNNPRNCALTIRLATALSLLMVCGLARRLPADDAVLQPREGIANCEVSRPSGDYALAMLRLSIPGDPKNADRNLRETRYWNYVGGLRDGRMRVDDGVGLRELGGWLEVKGNKLKGSFRRVDLNAVVKIDATFDERGEITGSATVGDSKAAVSGEYYKEDELAKRNAVDKGLSWPAAHGPRMGGCAAEPTGVTTIDSIDGLRMVWRCEETDIGRGMGNISRFMVTKWQDAAERRTGSGCASALVADGKVFFKYFVPSPGPAGSEDLPIKEYVFPATPPATGFVGATPKLAAERLLLQAREAGYQGKDLPPYVAEKTFATADDVMLCMGAATGKTLWKAVVKNRGVNSQHHKVGPFDLSPAYANGRVFALSTSGWLYAFDAESGKPLWETKASYDHSNALLAVGDLLVAPAGNEWGGYDAATGKLLWTAGGGRAMSTLSAWSREGKDYLLGLMGPSHDRKGIGCLDAATGERVWTLPVNVVTSGRGLGPGGITVFKDYLLVYQNNGTGKKDDPVKPALAAYKLTPTGAEPLWQVGDEEPASTDTNKIGCLHGESTPVVVRGNFVFTPDLRVVDLSTGKVLDQSSGPRPLNGGYMQAIEDIVLVRQDGTHGEHAQFGFYKVAANGSVRSFTETDWKPPIGGATSSYHHPIFYPAADGRVFLRQENGIYCWDLRKKID